MDKEKIQKAVRMILEAVGEDPKRDGLRDTPRRVAEFYQEIFAGLSQNPEGQIKLYSAPNQEEMIIVKDISFHSLCEHHLLPFFGKAHIAYIPKDNQITGFSRLVRVIEVLARRPQLQERLTAEIADVLMKVLKPKGVLVIMEAEQMCLSMRGLRKPGSVTITSAVRGDLRKDALRKEAFSLIKGSIPKDSSEGE
ncbi:MAG: GTP cyclohydrolase [candidate division Zixibacteria bacterium SM23_73_3]|nr:MAG: GTP cyclohydrolase [candidate division Zixibacteria bacterium SM23_73_3]